MLSGSSEEKDVLCQFNRLDTSAFIQLQQAEMIGCILQFFPSPLCFLARLGLEVLLSLVDFLLAGVESVLLISLFPLQFQIPTFSARAENERELFVDIRLVFHRINSKILQPLVQLHLPALQIHPQSLNQRRIPVFSRVPLIVLVCARAFATRECLRVWLCGDGGLRNLLREVALAHTLSLKRHTCGDCVI